MLGNFTYCNPTRLYFGEDSLSNLSTELKNLDKMWCLYMEEVLSKRMESMTR